MPEKCRGHTEPSERPRGVERAAARRRTPCPVGAEDHVDQRLTADDDHGTISPDPRTIRRVGTATWTAPSLTFGIGTMAGALFLNAPNFTRVGPCVGGRPVCPAPA